MKAGKKLNLLMYYLKTKTQKIMLEKLNKILIYSIF